MSHYEKDPFSGTDVVSYSSEIICLFKPSLLCLGQEHVPAPPSAVGITRLLWAKHQENEWPYPGRQAGKKGHATLGSWKAVSVWDRRETHFPERSCKTFHHLDETIL